MVFSMSAAFFQSSPVLWQTRARYLRVTEGDGLPFSVVVWSS